MLAATDTGTAIREWIVGSGRVIAAVVALHLGVWRERWRRPRLELHLDKSGDQDLVTLTTRPSSSGSRAARPPDQPAQDDVPVPNTSSFRLQRERDVVIDMPPEAPDSRGAFDGRLILRGVVEI